MKKFYVSPAIEVTAFVAEDILTTSSAFENVNLESVAGSGSTTGATGNVVGGKTVGSTTIGNSTVFIIE
ncbi:MAG: hypothetical protein IJT23_07525 [Clostridia bacterium]|nr:hypothetical protein [Clostridia bacterium]